MAQRIALGVVVTAFLAQTGLKLKFVLAARAPAALNGRFGSQHVKRLAPTVFVSRARHCCGALPSLLVDVVSTGVRRR